MEFNGSYPRPGLGPLTLSERLRFDEPTEETKDEYWPHATLPGVYVIYDYKHRLLYIGKASLSSTLGIRIAKHHKDRTQWSKYGRLFVRTIPLPRTRAFEAPALEEFLLSRLDTISNSHGQG